MNKKDANKLLSRFMRVKTWPVTNDFLVHYLYSRSSITTTGELIKIREYVKEFIYNNQASIAGGVLYPYKPDLWIPDKDATEGLKYGMFHVWKSLIKLTVRDGFKFGPRIVLSDVYVTNMDMRLGDVHYLDVGYTSYNVTRTWSKYFDDEAIARFAKNIDHRAGYSSIYRCHDDWKKGTPCLDSISVIFDTRETVTVHANFRVSNLNRMTLMDFFLLHRFIRLVFPIEMLSHISISCHFNAVALDLSMLGWLAKFSEFDELRKKYKPKYKELTGFKRMDLPIEFAKKKSVNDIGTNMFINNNYGIGGLADVEPNFRVSANKRKRITRKRKNK
jgi:hypothetical protein